MKSEITALILTYNEAPNLDRVLQKLTWASRVLVLDSFSTDGTETIARRFANVTFLQRQFDSFAGQCNFGLKQVETEWVFSIDADYLVTGELQSEIAQLTPEPDVVAYFARFRYCVAGRPLRGSLYPPRAVLFRKSKGHYVQDGHAHRLAFEGPSRFLKGFLWHDDRKPLTRWLASQQAYAALEARKLLENAGHNRSTADRLRQWIWPAAPAAFVYTLFVKRCLFDGWPGVYYALQRTYAELLLSLELVDRRLSAKDLPPTTAKVDSDRND
jgi:glycosyltransferase involved in cell wall biosynthesis